MVLWATGALPYPTPLQLWWVGYQNSLQTQCLPPWTLWNGHACHGFPSGMPVLFPPGLPDLDAPNPVPINLLPMSSSVGDTPVVCCGVFRYQNKNLDIWFIREPSFILDRPSFNVLTALSTRPFDAGCARAEVTWCVPLGCTNCWNSIICDNHVLEAKLSKQWAQSFHHCHRCSGGHWADLQPLRVSINSHQKSVP